MRHGPLFLRRFFLLEGVLRVLRLDDLIDRRGRLHGVLDGEHHRFVVVLVDLLVVVGASGDEHAADDDPLFSFVLRDDVVDDALDDGTGDSRLGGAEHLHHLARFLHGHLRDHHRLRLAGQIGADDGQQVGVAGRLVRERSREGLADGAVLGPDEQVDVGDVVQIELLRVSFFLDDETFADVHFRHESSPWNIPTPFSREEGKFATHQFGA